jgi:hypothetical protein
MKWLTFVGGHLRTKEFARVVLTAYGAIIAAIFATLILEKIRCGNAGMRNVM